MDASAADFLPKARSLASLRRAAQGCRGCDLWKDATQTVFGQGQRRAELMLVGEQPGDKEDLEGEPFVGPAGGLLDRVLTDAGIERDAVYLTNAVKLEACRPWLKAELEAVEPRAVVALGATAAKALFGSSVRVTRDRGRLLETPLAPVGAVTVHPSAILRIQERDERHDAFAGLVEDLVAVCAAMKKGVS
jgi:uracil-DNA glycosylase family 4